MNTNIFLDNAMLMVEKISFDLVALSLVALAFIHIFYYLFMLTWPEMYFSVSDSASLFISFSPVRYFAFRIIPILLIIALSLGISQSPSLNERLVAAFLIGLIHAAITNARAMKKIFTKNKSIHVYVNRTFQLFMHLVTIIVITLTAALAGFISSWDEIKNILPTPEGLRDNLWSSVITAMLAVFLYKLYQKKEIKTDDLFDKYLENIDKKLLAKIETVSNEKNVNVFLMKAICVVENIQRPRWIRKIEHAKSFFIPNGSYGIMQVNSSHFISDEKSIVLAAEKYFKNTESKKWDDLRIYVEEYNSTERYVEFVEQAYRHLSQEEVGYGR